MSTTNSLAYCQEKDENEILSYNQTQFNDKAKLIKCGVSSMQLLLVWIQTSTTTFWILFLHNNYDGIIIFII